MEGEQAESIVGLNHYRRYFDFSFMNSLFLPERQFMDINEFLQQPYEFPENLVSLLDKYGYSMYLFLFSFKYVKSAHIKSTWKTPNRKY